MIIRSRGSKRGPKPSTGVPAARSRLSAEPSESLGEIMVNFHFIGRPLDFKPLFWPEIDIWPILRPVATRATRATRASATDKGGQLGEGSEMNIFEKYFFYLDKIYWTPGLENIGHARATAHPELKILVFQYF